MRMRFGIEVKEEEKFVIGRENPFLCIVDKKVSRKQAILSFEIGFLKMIYFIYLFILFFYIAIICLFLFK